MIRPVGRDGIEPIPDSEDPRAQQNLLGLEAARIATAIMPLVKRENDPGGTARIGTFRRLLRIRVELEWSSGFSSWLGAILNRIFHIVALALVLGFTPFAVRELETLDGEFAGNDEVVFCTSIAAPCAEALSESSRSKLFRLAAPSLSPLPLLMAPVKAGRDLLNLLTLQRE